MIGNRGVAICRGIEPDLVTTGGLSVKLEAECLQPPKDVFVAEPGQPSDR